MPDLHRPDRVGVQDRPVHLLRRPQQAPIGPLDLGRRPGREDPRPEGRAVQRDAGIQEDLAPAGLPAGGPRGGPHAPRVRRMRAPESDRRRAGQDGAHHRARQGEPGPRSARCAAGSRRRPVRTGAGWSTSPTCRPGRGSAAPPSSRGLFSRRIVGRGRRQPHGAPTTRPAPPGRRSGRARTAGAATPGGPAPPRWPVPVHRLHRTTRRRGHRGIRRSRGLLLRGRRPLGQAPASAGPVLARRPLEGPRRPPGPPPPDG